MAYVTQWIRSLGGAGAVENAARACTQRRDEETAVEARLLQVAARYAISPARSEVTADRAA